MSTKRKNRARRPGADELTMKQCQELLIGPTGDDHSEFTDDAARLAAWKERGQELESEWDSDVVLWGRKQYGAPQGETR